MSSEAIEIDLKIVDNPDYTHSYTGGGAFLVIHI
jgi:hypothetical protein